MVHALITLPHDLMLAFSAADRERITLTAMSLTDRPRPKLELASDALGRHLFAFVWMLRDDLSTNRHHARGGRLPPARRQASRSIHAHQLDVSLSSQLRGFFCGPPGTRTPNLRIKSPQLCH